MIVENNLNCDPHCLGFHGNLWMSYDSWINIYSFAESIARIFYFIILPAQLFSSKITSSGGKRI